MTSFGKKLSKTSVGMLGFILLSHFACSNSPPAAPGSSGSSSGGGSGGGTSGSSTTGSATTGSGSASTGVSTGASGSASGSTGVGSGASGASSGGDGGAGGGGDGGTLPVDLSQSVLERGKHPSRDGHFVQPMLTKAAAMKMMPDTAFNTSATFTGAMWASPLYVELTPGGAGIYIAVSTTNDVTAFSDAGAQVWKKNIGLSPTAFGMGCGYPPIGILGTPVIDAKPGPDGAPTIYVSGAIGMPMLDHYELHALSAKDGSERTGWPAKLDNTLVGKNDMMTFPFAPSVHGQRAALSLVNGIVYVAFGGPKGDCGPYRGWIMGVDTTNPATISTWVTRGEGGAIWFSGGLASDGNGIFTITGNANYMGKFGPPPMWSDSEGVLRISGMPLARSDLYYPARWRQMDTDDQDFSSSSPMVMQVPGATPANYVVAVSKDGHLYFLNSASLGMMDGHVIDMTLASINHSSRVSPVAYTTATGSHIAITIDRGAMGCPATPAADPSKAVLMGLSVKPGTMPALTVTPSWCVTVAGPIVAAPTYGNRSASPIVTTTDGKSEPIVWIMGSPTAAVNPNGTTASILYGVDGESGATVYSGGTCTGVHQWTIPIAVKGHIVAGGDGHLCSWSPH